MTHPKLRRTREDRSGFQTNVVPGEYIVVFHDDVNERIDTIGSEMLRKYRDNTHVKRTFDTALPGFSAELSAFALIGLLHDKRVKYVEANILFSISSSQSNPDWGLDRIDQLDLPLDQEYRYNDALTGNGVDIYIFDTGVRKEHVDFGGRAACSRDIVSSSNACKDGNGHGTHVSAIAAGAVYGVAKNANIWSVRVCDNAGSCPLDNILAGFNHVINQTGNKKVVNMSIQGSSSSSLDSSILAAKNNGVVVVLAAGNWNTNACNTYARSANALTVGAVDAQDFKASFSNYGSCVDIWAPGVSIVSAGYASNTASEIKSGTSQAAPFVAGAVATLLGEGFSGFADVSSELLSRAVQGTLNNLRIGSPNLMLYLDSPSPSQAPSAAPTKSAEPSSAPSVSVAPSRIPSNYPTTEPTIHPSSFPTFQPSESPTRRPSRSPSRVPTVGPSVSLEPSQVPTQEPSPSPTSIPSQAPTRLPSSPPTLEPTQFPTHRPSQEPSTSPQPSNDIVVRPTCNRVGSLCWSDRGCCPGHNCRQRRVLRFLAGNCRTW